MIRRVFWNREEYRLTMLWRLVLQALLFLILVTLIPMAAGAAMGPFLFQGAGTSPETLTSNWGPAAIVSNAAFMLTGKLSALVATILSVWAAGRFLDRRRFADFGLHISREWWTDFGFGLFLGAFLMLLIFLVEWAAGWVTIEGLFANDLDSSPAVGLIGALIYFAAVGIQEELLSRGYHIKNLSEGLTGLPLFGIRASIILSTVVSSAIFGYLHATNPNATPISTFNIFLAGLFLALGFLLTGELAIPIGIHITWNFFQGKVFGFPVSGIPGDVSVIGMRQGGNDLITGGAFGPEAGLIGVAAMILGSLLVALWIRVRRKRITLRVQLAVPDLRTR